MNDSSTPLIDELVDLLPLATLRAVVIDAELARLNYVRPAHPRVTHGWTSYSERTALLRERLPSSIWRSWSRKNQEGVQSVDGALRLITMAGAPGTGNPDLPLKVVRKGVLTYDAVAANKSIVDTQILLFPTDELPPATAPDDDVVTYFLVVHRRQNIVRAELALVVKMSGAGRYCELECWERMAFLDVDLHDYVDGDLSDYVDGDASGDAAGDGEHDPDEFDFDVGELDT